MGLRELAAGVETTASQRARGVATVDATDADLAERLTEYADDLPCTPDGAAEVAEAYVGGATVGDAGREAGLAPVTAAKTLHLLGFEGVRPLPPGRRAVVEDWLRGEISRADAKTLADADERTFALAAFVATHDPLPGGREAVADALAADGDAMVEKRETLSETMSGPADLR